MSSISGTLPSPLISAATAAPVASSPTTPFTAGDHDNCPSVKKKPRKKGKQSARKRDDHNKRRSVRHKFVLQSLMVAIHNRDEQLGVAIRNHLQLLNSWIKRKKRRKCRKKWYRRGKHSHQKLFTKSIQNDPLRQVLWPLYGYITTLFRKRKRKRKYLCNVQSSSSSLHGITGKPFMPETLAPCGEHALFRGETMPAREKPQAGNPLKNPADSGIATGTSGTSGNSTGKAEPQPDTSALATGSSSQHQHKDQKFTHPSSHGAHAIPPDSMLLILSSHHERTPLEISTELPLTHSCMFGEREEFKPAASTFECCLGDERSPWDDGLPPVNVNPPQPSVNTHCSDGEPDNDHQLLNGQSVCQQPLPDHHGGPSVMIVPPLPVLPSNHVQFQEVPTEPAVLLPVAPDEHVIHNTEERVSLPDAFKPFPYLMDI